MGEKEQKIEHNMLLCITFPCNLHVKKVVSDCPELMDFAVGQVNSVLKLAKGQVTFLRGI